eukprot:SAG31_NODE_237_length_19590_cov_13.149915_16_plen_116_part_00
MHINTAVCGALAGGAVRTVVRYPDPCGLSPPIYPYTIAADTSTTASRRRRLGINNFRAAFLNPVACEQLGSWLLRLRSCWLLPPRHHPAPVHRRAPPAAVCVRRTIESIEGPSKR